MNSDLAEKAQAVPILSEIARRRIKLKRATAVEWVGPCPRCGGRDRFSINTAKDVFHCRGSGAGGDVIDLVRYLDEVDFVSAARMLGEGITPAHATSQGHARAEHRHSPVQDDWAHRGALKLWREAIPIVGTLAERYLCETRRLEPPIDVSPRALRFHPQCVFGDDRLPCLLALYRDIETNEPRAIHRTALLPGGRKLDRKALGPTRDAAIKISPDVAVGAGLTLGEGIETTLAGMQLGFRPAWAAGSAGTIATFPVLDGVESLTLLVDNDDAGRRAAAECSARWVAAECEVYRVVPRIIGEDLADIQRRRRT